MLPEMEVIELFAAYDRALLERLVDAVNTPRLLGLVQEVPFPLPDKGIREEHTARLKRLRELNAPESMIEHELYCIDPKASVVQQIKQTPNAVEPSELTFLAKRSILEGKFDAFYDLLWFQAPNYKGMGDYKLEQWGLIDDTHIRFGRSRETEFARDVLDAMRGTSNLNIKGVGVLDWMRHKHDAENWNWNWHEGNAREKALSCYRRLLTLEPPSEIDVLYSDRVMSYVCMSQGDEAPDDFRLPDRRWTYFELLGEIGRLLPRIIEFFETCISEHWEIGCSGMTER